MLDEITYPFPNFSRCTVEVWEWIRDYLSMLGLKLIHISKTGPWWRIYNASANWSVIGSGDGLNAKETTQKCPWDPYTEEMVSKVRLNIPRINILKYFPDNIEHFIPSSSEWTNGSGYVLSVSLSIIFIICAFCTPFWNRHQNVFPFNNISRLFM